MSDPSVVSIPVGITRDLEDGVNFITVTIPSWVLVALLHRGKGAIDINGPGTSVRLQVTDQVRSRADGTVDTWPIRGLCQKNIHGVVEPIPYVAALTEVMRSYPRVVVEEG